MDSSTSNILHQQGSLRIAACRHELSLPGGAGVSGPRIDDAVHVMPNHPSSTPAFHRDPPPIPNSLPARPPTTLGDSSAARSTSHRSFIENQRPPNHLLPPIHRHPPTNFVPKQPYQPQLAPYHHTNQPPNPSILQANRPPRFQQQNFHTPHTPIINDKPSSPHTHQQLEAPTTPDWNDDPHYRHWLQSKSQQQNEQRLPPSWPRNPPFQSHRNNRSVGAPWGQEARGSGHHDARFNYNSGSAVQNPNHTPRRTDLSASLSSLWSHTSDESSSSSDQDSPLNPRVHGFIQLPHGVCIDWAQGRCHRNFCRYEHRLPPDFLASLHQRSLSNASGSSADADDTSLRSSTSQLRETETDSKQEVCWEWLGGRCNNEEECLFAHDMSVTMTEPDSDESDEDDILPSGPQAQASTTPTPAPVTTPVPPPAPNGPQLQASPQEEKARSIPKTKASKTQPLSNTQPSSTSARKNDPTLPASLSSKPTSAPDEKVGSDTKTKPCAKPLTPADQSISSSPPTSQKPSQEKVKAKSTAKAAKSQKPSSVQAVISDTPLVAPSTSGENVKRKPKAQTAVSSPSPTVVAANDSLPPSSSKPAAASSASGEKASSSALQKPLQEKAKTRPKAKAVKSQLPSSTQATTSDTPAIVPSTSGENVKLGLKPQAIGSPATSALSPSSSSALQDKAKAKSKAKVAKSQISSSAQPAPSDMPAAASAATSQKRLQEKAEKPKAGSDAKVTKSQQTSSTQTTTSGTPVSALPTSGKKASLSTPQKPTQEKAKAASEAKVAKSKQPQTPTSDTPSAPSTSDKKASSKTKAQPPVPPPCPKATATSDPSPSPSSISQKPPQGKTKLRSEAKCQSPSPAHAPTSDTSVSAPSATISPSISKSHDTAKVESRSYLANRSRSKEYVKYPEVCRNWLHKKCVYTDLTCHRWHMVEVPKEALVARDAVDITLKQQDEQDLSPVAKIEEKSIASTHDRRDAPPHVAGIKEQKQESPIPQVHVHSTTQMPPETKRRQTCRKWLKQACPLLEHECVYYHTRDLPPEEPLDYVLNEHNRMQVSAGFAIEQVSTAFDTSSVYISGLPARFGGVEEARKMLEVFGEVKELKVWDKFSSTTLPRDEGKKQTQSQSQLKKSIKALFAEPKDALQAVASLNATQVLGNPITATIPLTTAIARSVRSQNTSVRLSWDAPRKIAYGGYATLAEARQAISHAKMTLVRNTYISARIHDDLPAVGPYTVKFSFVPCETTTEEMKRIFVQSQEIVWEAPNYSPDRLDEGKEHVKTLLMAFGDLIALDVMPPPWKGGKVRAWARFQDVGEAKRAANGVSGRKMLNGKAWIEAKHVNSMEYDFSERVYARISEDLKDMRKNSYFRHDHSLITETTRRITGGKMVRLIADEPKQLVLLKEELEVALRGEVVMEDSSTAEAGGFARKAAWDPYFVSQHGTDFLLAIQAMFRGVRIEVDEVRRNVKLFGKAEQRSLVRERIRQKLAELRKTKRFFIPIAQRLVGAFALSELRRLKMELGPENVLMLFYESVLRIRGDESAHARALEAVHRVQEMHPRRSAMTSTASSGSASLNSCPVCFGELTCPVFLPCGHMYCKACFISYLESVTDTKTFPIRCLGDEAKCGTPISIYTAQRILSSAQFESLIEAAFQTYIHSHSKEYHFCPTPDCHQIYRHPAPEGAILQCPECLVRICPRCDTEYHDGFDCPESEESQDERKFREWQVGRDVKACPGCRVVIERTEGCNHVRCSKCGVHICWVCLERFDDGNVVYDHLKSVHGGIGVAFAL